MILHFVHFATWKLPLTTVFYNARARTIAGPPRCDAKPMPLGPNTCTNIAPGHPTEIFEEFKLYFYQGIDGFYDSIGPTKVVYSGNLCKHVHVHNSN